RPEKPPQNPPANRSRLTRKPAAGASREPAVKESPDREGLLKDTPKEKLPAFIAPELAISVNEPPDGDAWLHELKLDGYRIQIHIDEKGPNPRARLFTRKGLDWTHRMPAIAEAAAQLPVHAAILDGEVVVLNAGGGTSFADLQAAFEEGAKHPLTYFAFDLLHLDGHNLRSLPLERRKAILESLLQETATDATLRYSTHIPSEGSEMFRHACTPGAE